MARNGGPAMLRLPVHGFAKRVEDTVARGMTVLRARDERAATRSQPMPAPKPKEQIGAAGGDGACR